uniref:Uncharacterized protein n=1 Tax=Aegilops tauschii subsp. strangulata TaxID=200361 RepID=A0A453QDA4_AEGTS
MAMAAPNNHPLSCAPSPDLHLLTCRSSKAKAQGYHLLPILGNLHQMGDLPHRSLRELARRHGPVMMLRLGTVPTLVVSSADAARDVLKTHDADCCSRPDTPGPRRLSYQHKDVAFSPYSEFWRERRKLMVIEFLSKRRIRATWHAREAEVGKLVSGLASTSQRRAEACAPGGSRLRVHGRHRRHGGVRQHLRHGALGAVQGALPPRDRRGHGGEVQLLCRGLLPQRPWPPRGPPHRRSLPPREGLQGVR